MNQDAARLARLWSDIVTRLRAEIVVLPASERDWIAGRLAAIALLQNELHACARAAGSEALCAACVEHCCGRGRHHLTLANLLFYLLAGIDPPPADFTAPCPQLGAHGCHIPPERRPFNCITFNCSAVEERMSAPQRQRFYTLEPALRALYESFDARYAGSSLHGLLIRAATLGPRPFLGRRRPS